MSLHALTWAFDQEIKISTRKFVLVSLANFASDRQLSYPAVSTLVRLTSQDERTVTRCLDDLERDGFIKDTGQRVGKTKQIKVYQLLLNTHNNAGVQTPAECQSLNGERPPKMLSKTPILANAYIQGNPMEPSLTPFERFWMKYPQRKRKAKRNAEKAFIKLKCHTFIESILAALEAQKQSSDWVKEGGQFIPLPATWLNGGRWDDEVGPPTNGHAVKVADPNAVLQWGGVTFTRDRPPMRKDFPDDRGFETANTMYQQKLNQ